MGHNHGESHKGQFGSNFGFLMAAIGSAVGLGNLWGFPYKMGANGGFAFLLLYLVLVVFVGYVIMMSELALGRSTGKGVIGAYKSTIKLPENAYGARVAFPNPSGCKDYTNLSLGVNWNLTTIQNDQIVITWWFYTFVLNYNMAGQQIYEVAPIDGAKVKVPYFYMLP